MGSCKKSMYQGQREGLMLCISIHNKVFPKKIEAVRQHCFIITVLTLYVFSIELSLKQIQLLIHIILQKRISTYLSDRLFDNLLHANNMPRFCYKNYVNSLNAIFNN